LVGSIALLAVGVVLLMGLVLARTGTSQLTQSTRAARTGSSIAGHVAKSSQSSSALPVAARLAVSRGLGASLSAYQLAPSSTGGFLAHNPHQGLSASFGDGGAVIGARDGGHASIALRSIGFGSAVQPVVGAAVPVAVDNRVEYRRTGTGVTEWFANGPAGIEQGFTISRPPATASDGAGNPYANRGPLTLELGVSGSLHVHPGGDGGGVVFDTHAGRPELSYGELSVSDVTGRALPARMVFKHGQLSIRIEANGAHYPLRVDPLIASAELYAEHGAEDEELGYSVAVSGKTVVAGAPTATEGGHMDAGVAFVFTEGPSGWETGPQKIELLPPASEEGAKFGHSVAISGKTIVVGAPFATANETESGAAYVFSEPSGGWAAMTEQHPTAELYDSENEIEPEFGKSVAVNGETVVVGSPRYVNYTYSGKPTIGSAFVFVRPSGGWATGGSKHTQSFTLMETEKEATEYEEDDYFGASVAIDESEGEQTVAVVAPGAKVDGHYRQGVALLFNRPTQGWTVPDPIKLESNPGAVLTVSNGAAGDRLGESDVFSEGQTLAISGNEIVIGDPEVEDGSNKYEGAAYVFTKPTGGWEAQREQTQAATLLPSNGGASWYFGRTVAAEGATIGAVGDGNLYVYLMPVGGWSGELDQSSELVGAATSVSLTPGYALVGDAALSPITKYQGGVLVVPLGPAVTTNSTSGISTEAATIEGSIDPDRNAVSSCVFQYGTTDFYGKEASCSQTVGSGSAAITVSAALSGLSPETTYHYRLVGINADGTSYGLDRTFTTAAGEKPAGKSGEEPSKSASTSTFTNSSASTTTGSSSAQPTSASPPASAAAVLEASRALACSTAQVALINVVAQGSHVLIAGAARQVLAGKQVSIKLLSTGKTVATPTVSAAGTFSATVPLPPAKVLDSNRTRYQASIGSLSSLALKLERRAYMVHATLSGKHVSIAGRVTGSFRPGTPVRITLRVTCAKYKTVATVKLTGAGTFSATVPAPSGASSQIAVYRAITTVLKGGHPFATFTLPTPPS
jgi:hypothetical protein